MAKSPNERRKQPRSRKGFSIAPGEDGLLRAVDNISATGILCHTSRAVEEMTRMGIDLDLPGTEHPVHVEGVVVRCDADEDSDGEYRVAIVFTKMSEADEALVREFVEQDLAET